MKEAKNVMHVGLERPIEKRRDILSSAVGTIEILKRYEDFKKRKKEKEEFKRELKLLAKEIKTLYSEVEELMPQVELPREALPKKGEPVRVKVVKKKSVIFKPVKKEEHFTKLDNDLQALKEKIARL